MFCTARVMIACLNLKIDSWYNRLLLHLPPSDHWAPLIIECIIFMIAWIFTPAVPFNSGV
jgi:hypothetical protein